MFWPAVILPVVVTLTEALATGFVLFTVTLSCALATLVSSYDVAYIGPGQCLQGL